MSTGRLNSDPKVHLALPAANHVTRPSSATSTLNVDG